jgi:hypothetical protein
MNYMFINVKGSLANEPRAERGTVVR